MSVDHNKYQKPTSKDSLQVEAMKQALETLEQYSGVNERACDAEESLRQAIEQAEKQEPVGEIVQAFEGLTAVSIPVMPPVGTKLYAAPPQREWVGLTEDEITELFCDYDSSQPD